jgi:outer membrane protein assembly factor BamB
MIDETGLEQQLRDWMSTERDIRAPDGLLSHVVETTARRRPKARPLALLREPELRRAGTTVIGLPHRRLLLLVAALALTAASLLTAAGAAVLLRQAPAITEDWLGFRGNASRTGLTVAGPTGQPVRAWTFHAGGAANTAIAIVGSTVVAATDDGVVHAIALDSGVERWSARLAAAGGNVAVVDGAVIVSDSRGAVYALDLGTGTTNWKHELGLRGPFDLTAAGAVIVASGGPDGVLAALDPATGSIAWQRTAGVSGAPAFDGRSLFVPGDGVEEDDPSTGQVLWHSNTKGDPVGTVAVGEGIVYVGGVHEPPYGHLRAFDSGTGDLRWTSSAGLLAPALWDRLAIAGSGAGDLTALDGSTGAPVWSVRLPGVVREPAAAQRVVYALSEGSGVVHALDAATGSERWQIALDPGAACCLAVAHGYLVVGSQTGAIFAIRGGGEPQARSAGPLSESASPFQSPKASPSSRPITTPSPGNLTTLAWTAEAAPGEQFNWPNAIAEAPDGTVWVADPWNDRFAIYDAAGEFREYWNSPASGDGRFTLNRPNTDGYGGIAFFPDGSFVVLDAGERRVIHFDRARKVVDAWGGFGSQPGKFLDPVAITVAGGSVYVLDDQRGDVERLSASGAVLRSFDVFSNLSGASSRGGAGIAVDGEGNVYVGQVGPSQVAEFTAEGSFVRVFGAPDSGAPLPGFGGFVVDGSRRVIVAGFGGVWVYDASGRLVGTVGGNGPEGVAFGAGIALDADGHVDVVDAGNVGAGDIDHGHLKRFDLRP